MEFEVNDCEGFLTERFIQVRFSMARNCIQSLKKMEDHYRVAEPVFANLAEERTSNWVHRRVSHVEVWAVLRCLQGLVEFCDSEGDIDFADDIYNLMHSFVKSLSKLGRSS